MPQDRPPVGAIGPHTRLVVEGFIEIDGRPGGVTVLVKDGPAEHARQYGSGATLDEAEDVSRYMAAVFQRAHLRDTLERTATRRLPHPHVRQPRTRKRGRCPGGRPRGRRAARARGPDDPEGESEHHHLAGSRRP